MSHSLILVPTPISEELSLEPTALALLMADCLKPDVGLLVEEHKVGRQRWLKWGLPREAIERFELYNEHTQVDLIPQILAEMRKGKRFYLMSDSGLPAFCDPGQKLVDACHEKALKVTATPFPNSIALVVALSGFNHSEFHFAGFLPANSDDRKTALERLARIPQTLVLMDTPYRMQALLKDIDASPLKKRRVFVGCNLNQPSEYLCRGSIREVQGLLAAAGKKEFVMVIESLN
jgi:16S rRNA (cytidine1402-2'-O)-methyltransferase